MAYDEWATDELINLIHGNYSEGDYHYAVKKVRGYVTSGKAKSPDELIRRVIVGLQCGGFGEPPTFTKEVKRYRIDFREVALVAIGNAFGNHWLHDLFK